MRSPVVSVHVRPPELRAILDCRDGRTPLHEIAAKGQAPTVLLLAAEPDSELASGSGGGGRECSASQSGSASVTTETSVLGSSDSNSASTGIAGGGDKLSGDDSESGGGVDGGAVVPALPSSLPSASRAAAPATADNGIGDSMNAADAVSTTVDGASTDIESARKANVDNADAAISTPTPAALPLIRIPHPLSDFAAPSLADTDEDHEVSAFADDVGQVQHVPGDSISPKSPGNHPNKNTRGSFVAAEGGPWGPHENDTSLIHGSSSGNGSPDTTGQDNGVEEEEASAWGGLLAVDVHCLESVNCPLHEAAASGSVGAVLSLLDLGADVAAVNGRGDTALHVSQTSRYNYGG